jgi:hypothetical protein
MFGIDGQSSVSSFHEDARRFVYDVEHRSAIRIGRLHLIVLGELLRDRPHTRIVRDLAPRHGTGKVVEVLIEVRTLIRHGLLGDLASEAEQERS